MAKIKRKIDTKMRSSGDSDFKKKTIRINPRRLELLNTILHEEIHIKNDNLTEKQVKKKAKEQEKKLTLRKAIKLLKRFV